VAPVFLATDKDTVATRATVESARFERVPVRPRTLADPDSPFVPYRVAQADEVPPMAHFGGPHLVRLTSSSHDERGYLTKAPADLDQLNRHLAAKIEQHVDEIALIEADLQTGAETLIVGYGITARPVQDAVRAAREAGQRVSALIVRSLWPVPEGAIRAALTGVRRVVVAELNLGQYRREIERLACDDQEIIGVHRVDGTLIGAEDILIEGGLA